MTSPNETPTPSEVNKIHSNCDVDTAPTSQHHTLGILHTQASPGDHLHDGKNSKRLGKGKNLAFPTTAGATYTQSQIQAIIDALRALGWGT
jgi:hypothetical protein